MSKLPKNNNQTSPALHHPTRQPEPEPVPPQTPRDQLQQQSKARQPTDPRPPIKARGRMAPTERAHRSGKSTPFTHYWLFLLIRRKQKLAQDKILQQKLFVQLS